jgi:hypothetical protein
VSGPVPKQLSAENFQGLVGDYPGEAEALFQFINENTRKTSQGLEGAVSLGETLSVVPVTFTTPATGGEAHCVARYKTGAAGSYAANQAHIVNFETKDYDTHGAVTVGSTWKFVAPFSGDYAVSGSLLVASHLQAAGDQHDIQIFRNGSLFSVMGTSFGQGTPTTFVGINGSAIVNLDRGGYLDVRYYQTTGTRALQANAVFNYVQVHRLYDPRATDLAGVSVKKGVRGKVQAVLVGRVEKQKSTERIVSPRISWDEDGDTIRIRSVHGLQPSTTYKLTLAVIGGG